MSTRVAVVGLLVLFALAVWDRSAVMAVSVAGMGGAWWAVHAASRRRRVAAAAVGAVASALLAEGVHTLYHRIAPFEAFGDTGGFWFAATVIGLANAVVFGAVLLVADWAERRQARASRSSAS